MVHLVGEAMLRHLVRLLVEAMLRSSAILWQRSLVMAYDAYLP